MWNDGSDDHALLLMSPPDQTTVNYTVVDVNLTTEAPQVIECDKGAPEIKITEIDAAKAYLYLATDAPGGSDGLLGRIDLATWGYSQLTALSQRPYRMRIAPSDGTLWIGAKTYAELSMYNPSTSTLTNYGSVVEETNTYVLNLVPLADYVYGSLGYDPYRLFAFNRSTQVVTVYFDGNDDLGASLQFAADHSATYYRRTLADSSLQWYACLNDGSVSAIGAGEVPVLDSQDWGVVKRDKATAPFTFWDFDFSDVIPLDANDTTLRYKAAGGPTYTEVTLSGITRGDVPLARIMQFDADNWLVFPYTYYPVAQMTKATEVVSVQGFTTASLRAALVDGTDVYLAGYYAKFLRWDTTAEWTLSASDTDLSATNPRLIASTAVDYQFLAMDSTGHIWAAGQNVRHSDGGELTEYDPVGDTVTEHKSSLGLGVVYPSGLCAVGDYLVLSIRPVAGNGSFMVIDPVDGSLVRSIAAPTNDPGYLIAVSSTDFVSISTYKYGRYNVDGSTIYAKTSVAPLFGSDDLYVYERYAEVSGNGQIWLWIGDYVRAIAPNGDLLPVVYAPQFGAVSRFDDTPWTLLNGRNYSPTGIKPIV